jgi:hypothetical protein
MTPTHHSSKLNKIINSIYTCFKIMSIRYLKEYNRLMRQWDNNRYIDLNSLTVEHDNLNVNTSNNPIASQQSNECILVNSKKHKYYKFNYIPSRLVEHITNQQYLNYVKQVFDLTDDPATARCNCISLTLYSLYRKEDLSNVNVIINYLDKLCNYLVSINRTIKNVARNLHDWLVRLYLDKSVYDLIFDTEQLLDDSASSSETIKLQYRYSRAINYYNAIMLKDNVEIYTYLCSSIFDTKDRNEMGKTRTFRYLPLLDNTVNTVIIREADGIVTNLDCRNISIFSTSNKILYLLPFLHSTNHTNEGIALLQHSYSQWLTYYKKVIEPEYFSRKNNLYDIMAGMFGCNLKIKLDVYYHTIEKINNYLDTTTFLLRSGKNLLLDGFDEIVLLDILKNILSANIVSKRPENFGTATVYRLAYDTVLYDEILNNIIAEHNIVVVNSIEEIYNENVVVLQQPVQLENLVDNYYRDLNVRDEQLYSIMLDTIFSVKFLNTNNHNVYNFPRITRLVNDPYARIDYGETDTLSDNVYYEFTNLVEQFML